MRRRDADSMRKFLLPLFSCFGSQRARLLLQLLATVAVLGWLPDNSIKLVTMLIIWGLGFGRIRKSELLVMGSVNSVFFILNFAALRRGIFAFNHPDFLQMPVYEFLMWGFYTLHAIRFLGGARPSTNWFIALSAAGAFALPFVSLTDPDLLVAISAGVLVIYLALFHDPMDLAYAGYLAGLGTLVEYTGVWTGQWHYPGAYYGGVPLWFLTMWAGVGLFTRRILLPILAADSHNPARVA